LPLAFADSLPEDIRGDAVFRDIKDLGSLAKGYKNAQQLIGKIGANPDSVVAIPAADDAEAWKAFHNKLGRPETADKYALPDVKLPEGMAIDEKLRTNFTTRAHDLGLSTKQAAGLYEWWNSEMGGQHTAGSQARAQAEEQGVASLRTEWGQAFDQKLGDAKAGLAHYAEGDLVAYLEQSRLGNDPRLIKTFAKLGAQLREDGIVGRGGAGDGGMKSPTEARQEIAALRQDAQFSKAYMDGKAPGHKEAVERMSRLHQMAFPQ